MAKIKQRFVITIPQLHGDRLEVYGIVENKDPEQYDIEEVLYHTLKDGDPATETVGAFFKLVRTKDPEYLHEEICNGIAVWLGDCVKYLPKQEGFTPEDHIERLAQGIPELPMPVRHINSLSSYFNAAS